jgi:hypothetical protein
MWNSTKYKLGLIYKEIEYSLDMSDFDLNEEMSEVLIK